MGMRRVQQRRGVALPPGVRSVARPSRWGNPYRLATERDRPDVIARYRRWLDEQLGNDPAFLEPLRTAAGLACYCAPDVECHADILIEAIEGSTGGAGESASSC